MPLSLPQRLDTGGSPSFVGLTLSGATALTLSAEDATILNAGGGKIVFNTTDRQLQIHPGSEARPLWQLEDAVAAGGTDRTDVRLTLWGRSGAGAVANYFSDQTNFGAIDGTSAAASYGIGSDGQWTNGGGFLTTTKFWLFDDINDVHLLKHEQATPKIFEIGETVSSKGLSLFVPGRDIITSDADGLVASFDTAPDFVVDDANTRTWYVARIKPTLNFGSGTPNANKTVYGLLLDNTHTNNTGLAYISLQINSAANIGNDQIRNLHSSDSAAGGSALFIKSRGTNAQLYRVQSGDNMGGINARGYWNATDNTTTGTAGATSGQFQFFSAETFVSATNLGTNFRINLTPAGSGTVAEYLRLTSANNMKLAGTASRGTTEGTNHFSLFNGTAPVGTLTNGISVYSASGRLKLLDATGLDGHVMSGSAVNTVTATLPNRTITVDVGGTTLYIHAKTTND